MAEERNPSGVERVMVAVDGSSHSRAALEAATELAASLEVELIGIFVEDVNLMRLAELPIGIEIETPTGQVRRIDPRRLRRQIAWRARRAKRMMAEMAGKRGISWRFYIRQGHIHEELMAASAPGDLVILGKAGWSGRKNLGSTARAMLVQAQAVVLFIEEDARLQPSFFVVYDGSRESLRALHLTAHLAELRHGFITIGIRAENETQARDLQHEAAEYLRRVGHPAHVRWLIGPSHQRLARLMAEAGQKCLLVMPRSDNPQEHQAMASLLGQVHCPVLVVE
jgi:nucleotide-binding universal stress UspA family protein